MSDKYADAVCVPGCLKVFFQNTPKAALAFSGGVDSAYLLYAARACGCDIRPYYIKSAFQPAFEMRDARRLCDQLGVKMKIVELDVLGVPGVAENPVNRCYYCKTALFSKLIQAAKADGCHIMIDGTNASDDASDRPGMKALNELNVLSPLRMCDITKKEVREYSRKAGLFTWDKPAYACLATRIPANTEISEAILKRIEDAEDALFNMGFSDFRVRVYEGAARLQLPQDQMQRAIEMRAEICSALENAFPIVMMDLRNR